MQFFRSKFKHKRLRNRDSNEDIDFEDVNIFDTHNVPDNIQIHIFSYLSIKQLQRTVVVVCKKYYKMICHEKHIWRSISNGIRKLKIQFIYVHNRVLPNISFGNSNDTFRAPSKELLSKFQLFDSLCLNELEINPGFKPVSLEYRIQHQIAMRYLYQLILNPNDNDRYLTIIHSNKVTFWSPVDKEGQLLTQQRIVQSNFNQNYQNNNNMNNIKNNNNNNNNSKNKNNSKMNKPYSGRNNTNNIKNNKNNSRNNSRNNRRYSKNGTINHNNKNNNINNNSNNNINIDVNINLNDKKMLIMTDIFNEILDLTKCSILDTQCAIIPINISYSSCQNILELYVGDETQKHYNFYDFITILSKLINLEIIHIGWLLKKSSYTNNDDFEKAAMARMNIIPWPKSLKCLYWIREPFKGCMDIFELDIKSKCPNLITFEYEQR